MLELSTLVYLNWSNHVSVDQLEETFNTMDLIFNLELSSLEPHILFSVQVQASPGESADAFDIIFITL